MSTNKTVISDDESFDGIDECQRDITPKSDGGVLKQIVQGGRYRAKPNKFLDDDVLIHVVGTLKKTNKVFYNTRKLEQPIKSRLRLQFGPDEATQPNLPLALDIAIRTMKKHEIALLTCKPEYCYGAEPHKEKDFLCEVPANSTIVFEVELLDFRFNDLTKEKDGGVLLRRRFKQGEGDFYPTYNSEVCCDISIYDDYKGNQTGFESAPFSSRDGRDLSFTKMFDWNDSSFYGDDYEFDSEIKEKTNEKHITEIFKRKNSNVWLSNELELSRKSNECLELQDFTWTLGEGELHRIPKGVEIAIENMVVGERAMFFIRYDYLKEMLNAEVYADAEEHSDFYHVIIQLKSCKRAKEYYEMNGEERLAESKECKLKGNLYLTEQRNVRLALKRFKRAIDLLETSVDLDGENEERDQLLFACYLNISKAYFDAKTPELCADYLDKALKMQPTSEKAMYRYGLLLMERKMYAEAKDQFDRMIAVYPANKVAASLAKQCVLKVQEQTIAERELCKKMLCKNLG